MDSMANFGDLSVEAPEPALAALDQRVRHLEEVVAALQERMRSEVHQVKVGPAPLDERAAAAHVTEASPSAEPFVPVAAAPWLLVDILVEARAMVRMFFDIHYRMSWYTRAAVVVLLLMILTSGLWLGWVPVIGTVLVKIWDLALAFLIYKILTREARRYREIRGS